MSGWPVLENELSDWCDTEFSERIGLVPMRKIANARPIPDPERAEAEVLGIFDWTSDDVELRKGQDLSHVPRAAIHASRKPRVSFDVRRLPYDLVEGDLIVLLDRGDLLFEVLSPDKDGQGRVKCQLTQRGVHT